ncbi:MAG TPA: universal stress protein [Caulobacteraceae bacterium]
MTWTRIMVPLAGAENDRTALAAGRTIAEAFDAELAAVHAPADIADLMPWMGEGFMGGVQISAVESLKEAAEEGGAAAASACQATHYEKTRLISLETPVWAGLAAEARLSEVVIFDCQAARGRGPLAEAFQQIIADEQRPILVAHDGLRLDGTVVVAWDGGKEASRAVRKALPLLKKASRVVLVGAPEASSRTFDLARLQAFLAARGVKAEAQVIEGHSDAGRLLLEAAREAGADILVAGAFGHTRLREYIFGGTTRTLLNSDGPSLFLSH